jgi:hypothetical protein
MAYDLGRLMASFMAFTLLELVRVSMQFATSTSNLWWILHRLIIVRRQHQVEIEAGYWQQTPF